MPTPPSARARVAAIGTVLFALLLAGCAGSGTTPAATLAAVSDDAPEAAFRIDATAYPRAFDAARDVLRRQGFRIERVDARAGVITTDAKPTGGLLTPWDAQQQTLYAELEDTLVNQRRFVRVTIEPDDLVTTDPTLYDLRQWANGAGAGAGATLRVHVTLERVQRPGRRMSTQSVRLVTRTEDPELRRRGMYPAYEVAFSEDPALAASLAREIRQRMLKPR